MHDKYQTGMNITTGWIATIGQCDYRHRFGGDSWHLQAPKRKCAPPLLLAVIDMRDARLQSALQLSEIPLCSYLHCQAWVNRQEYEVKCESQTVVEVTSEHSCDDDLGAILPELLPERRLSLRTMTKHEIPRDEESYWSACDSFVGGRSFIRVWGPPIWLMDTIEVTCFCGRAAAYFASIGYENPCDPGGYLDDAPFFFGEGALYFFLCERQAHLIVLSQPT